MSQKSKIEKARARRQTVTEVLTLVFQLTHGPVPPDDAPEPYWLCYRLLHNPDAVPPTGLTRAGVEQAEATAQQTRETAFGLIQGNVAFEAFVEEVKGGRVDQLGRVHQLAAALRKLEPDLELPQLPPLPETQHPLVPSRPVKVPLTLHLQVNPDRLPDIGRLYTEIREILQGPAGEALENAIRENRYLGNMLAPREDAVTMWLPRTDDDLLADFEEVREPTRQTARRAILKTLRRDWFQTKARYDLEWVTGPDGRGGYWIARVPDEKDPERVRHYRVSLERQPGKRRKQVVVKRLL